MSVGILGTINDPYQNDASGNVRIFQRFGNRGPFIQVNQYYVEDRPDYGSTVTLDHDGLWGFSLLPVLTSQLGEVFVHDMLNRGAPKWMVVHEWDPDTEVGDFLVMPQREGTNFSTSFPDCSVEHNECNIADLHGGDGFVVFSCLLPRSMTSGSTFYLGCKLMLNKTTGMPESALPIGLHTVDADSNQRWTVIDLAVDSLDGVSFTFLLCITTATRLSVRCNAFFTYNNSTDIAVPCPAPEAISIYAGIVAVSCPPQDSVLVFDCKGAGQCAQLQSVLSPYWRSPVNNGTIGFGLGISFVDGILVVDASNFSALYRWKDDGTFALENVLPNLWYNLDNGGLRHVQAFGSAVLSGSSVVSFPLSFLPISNAVYTFNSSAAGERWDVGTQTPRSCLPGQHKDVAGFSSCSLCPVGTYSASTESCLNCTRSPDPTYASLCPAGSWEQININSSELEFALALPEIDQEVRLDLEVLFYTSSWPIFLYVLGATLVLGIALIFFNWIFTQNPLWRQGVYQFHKMNIFSREHPPDQDQGHHSHEHGSSHGRTQGGGMKWFGTLLTVFFVAVLALLIVFSIYYLSYSLTHSQRVFQIGPNTHKDKGPVDRPNLNISIYLYGMATKLCDPRAFLVETNFMLQSPVPSFFYTFTPKGALECNISITINNTKIPNSGAITFNYLPPDVTGTPFYTQGIRYYVSADYAGTEVEDWLPAPSLGSDDQGSSQMGGVIFAHPGYFLSGTSVIGIISTPQMVQLCEEDGDGTDSVSFWASFFKSGKLSCRNTIASAGHYSTSQIVLAELNSSRYGVESDGFGVSLQFNEADHATTVLLIKSTSYSEVITATILVMIGLYHLCHILHAICENAALSGHKIWRKWCQKRTDSGSVQFESQELLFPDVLQEGS